MFACGTASRACYADDIPCHYFFTFGGVNDGEVAVTDGVFTVAKTNEVTRTAIGAYFLDDTVEHRHYFGITGVEVEAVVGGGTTREGVTACTVGGIDTNIFEGVGYAVVAVYPVVSGLIGGTFC